MRILVIAMAVCIGPIILWQFLAKKGSWAHVVRYIAVCLLSVAIVVLNTSYMQVKWDRAFAFHVIAGSVYFLGLAVVGISGWQLKRGRVSRKFHRWSIGITLVFLFLTALVPRILR